MSVAETRDAGAGTADSAVAQVAGHEAAAIRAVAERVAEAGQSSPRQARDPVNLPMIRSWIEAIGDANPVYTDPQAAAESVHRGLVAPPAMVQVWTMPGLHGIRDADDPLGQMSSVLDDAGYTSVVATNCDQVYHRYLRHGEQLTVRASLVDVTGPKRTALGDGWFVTTRSTWYSGDEAVATMDFRILKFRPPSPGQPVARADVASPSQPATESGGPASDPDLGPVMRPAISPDTAFFWDGAALGELRIQRCGDCGALRHPPGPMCPQCGAANRQHVVAAGTGEVFSYVVHHHPPVPGKRLPIVIAVVSLDEGVRMVGELVGADPGQVRVGLPVQVEFVRIDDGLTLPAWRPRKLAADQLPELVIAASTTFVVSTALATRDFQDVHHDRDQAIARGSNDIFLNILTSTGLVQRYVGQWAGSQAVVRQISIRLGAPCYAGDTLTFSGHVISRAAGPDGEKYEVAVVGRCSLGDHVTGSVRIDVSASER